MIESTHSTNLGLNGFFSFSNLDACGQEFGQLLANHGLCTQDFLKHSKLYNYHTLSFLYEIIKRKNQADFRVLEVGAGIGHTAFLLTKFYKNVCLVELEDPTAHDPREINDLRENFREKVWKDIEIKNQCSIESFIYDGHDLNFFKDEEFDVVVMDGVYEHIHPDHAPNILIEVRRILKPDGLFAIDRCPNRLGWRENVLKWLDLPRHSRSFSKRELKRNLSQAGFLIEKISALDLFPSFYPIGLINRTYKLLYKVESALIKVGMRAIASNFRAINNLARKVKSSQGSPCSGIANRGFFYS